MPKHRFSAADIALPEITRRAALAAPLALLPSNSLARPESQILRLFRQYQRLRTVFKSAYELGDEATEEHIFQRMISIEEKIIALPSTCAADFAAKVILDTARASLFSDWETGKVWIEARMLTGCELH